MKLLSFFHRNNKYLQAVDNRTWATLTNLFFLIPVVVSIVIGEILVTRLLVAVIVISISYHLHKPDGVDWYWNRKHRPSQRFMLYLDTAGGFTIAGVVIKDLLMNLPLSVLDIIGVAIVIVGVYYLMLKTKHLYNFHHGLWHVLAAVGLAIVLI